MKKKIIAIAIIAVAVVVAVMGFVTQINTPLNTIKAQYSYFEDAIGVSGIVIRTEDVYHKEADTVFESEKKEGQRIPAGSVIGTVYGKDAPKDVISSITELNSRIENIRSKQSGVQFEYDDISKVESRMAVVTEYLIDAAQEADGQVVSSYKYELDLLLRNKLQLNGKASDDSNELSLLEAKRDKLEAELDKTDIVCRTSGILTYVVDGFEGELTADLITKLNPEAVDAWIEYNPEIPEDAYSKIVVNDSWFFSFNLTEKQLDNMKVYDNAYIKTTAESTDLIGVTVYDISEKSPDGRVTVTVECTRDVNSALTNRKLDLIFVKKIYEGYKIPNTAVHVKDDVVGVYALMGGIVEFRPIKIVYSGEDYVIISNEYDSETNRIHMYDEIIISTEGIKEGMLFT